MDTKSINIYGTFGQGTGWAGASERIAIALEKENIDVRLISSKKINHSVLTKEGLELFKKPFKLCDIGLAIGYPITFTSMMNRVNLGLAMHETNKLPTGSVWAGKTNNAMDIINHLNALIVPCEHNRKLFLSSGCKIPVHNVNLGIDDNVYFDMTDKRQATRKNRPYTFLMLANLTPRKGLHEALIAFMSLFPNNKDVKLVIKTGGNNPLRLDFDKKYNIEIINKTCNTEDLLEIYSNADCFIYPSKGEGFGLTPLEAMTTGLPTIFANNTGMSEYANIEYNYPIRSVVESPAKHYPQGFGDVGTWFEIDMDMFKENIMHVYENQAEAIQKGRNASDWVLKNFTYKQTAIKLKEIMSQYA